MRLSEHYRLEIKVAKRDDDGDFMSPLYDNPDGLLATRDDGPAYPKAAFVFCVIDDRTGKEPPNMAEAYEDVNDAYSAWVNATYDERMRDAEAKETERLYQALRDEHVGINHFEKDGTHLLAISFVWGYRQKAWCDDGKDLKRLLADALAFVRRTKTVT